MAIQIPDIPGITRLTPLQTNTVRFDKKHTVLTPELLASMSGEPAGKNIKVKSQ